MRRLRNLSFILFAFSLILFGVTRWRELSLQDTSGPVIKLDSDKIEISVEDPEEKLLEGVTAEDKRDGDVTSSIVVENVSTFLRPGTRIVRYAAFDKDMHVSLVEREMTYTDYRSPEFSITQPLILAPGKTNLLDHVTVSDVLDGSLKDSIKVLSDKELLVDTEGEYEVRLQAANSAGDVSTLPVIVRVEETNRSTPQILLFNYVRYLDQGEEFDPYAQIKQVSINGRSYGVEQGRGNYGKESLSKDDEVVVGTKQIVVKNSVDTSTPGNYMVKYSMTISVGSDGDRLTGVTYLCVVVRDDYRLVEDSENTENAEDSQGE